MPRTKAEGGEARPWEKHPQAPPWNAKKGKLTLINKNNNKETLKHFQIYLSKIGH